MANYASKDAVLSALNQKRAQVTELEEKKRLLDEALTNVVNVQGRVTALNTELTDWGSSLNAFGSFSWEGTQVHESQSLITGALSEQYASYAGGLGTWQSALSEAANQAATDLKSAQTESSNLSWEYYTWDANHPFDLT
ncbi:MAG: hypothetical protein LBP24_04250 [Coriobacteriales bacterium]|jgi:hypothetical protein|nr:hypothetical protein [Coriobacteriales bacterium]